MKRLVRLAFAFFAAWAACSAAGAADNAQLKLIYAGCVGDLHLLGLQVNLAKGWKTYWRVPGDAGVPPQIDFGESLNIDTRATAIFYPTPRFYNAGGVRMLGYENSVVFPLLLMHQHPGLPMSVVADVTLGLCSTVCIPLRQRVEASFPAQRVDLPDDLALKLGIDQKRFRPSPCKTMASKPLEFTPAWRAIVDDLPDPGGVTLSSLQQTVAGEGAVLELRFGKAPPLQAAVLEACQLTPHGCETKLAETLADSIEMQAEQTVVRVKLAKPLPPRAQLTWTLIGNSKSYEIRDELKE